MASTPNSLSALDQRIYPEIELTDWEKSPPNLQPDTWSRRRPDFVNLDPCPPKDGFPDPGLNMEVSHPWLYAKSLPQVQGFRILLLSLLSDKDRNFCPRLQDRRGQ